MPNHTPTFRASAVPNATPRTFVLEGIVDENADLSFFADVQGRIRINLHGVRRISSFGVRAWNEAIRRVPVGAAMEFVECPPPLIDQINLVSGFLGTGTLVSFEVPYACEECDREETRLLLVEECRRHGGKLSPIPCPGCGKPTAPDVLESLFLRFLHEVR